MGLSQLRNPALSLCLIDRRSMELRHPQVLDLVALNEVCVVGLVSMSEVKESGQVMGFVDLLERLCKDEMSLSAFASKDMYFISNYRCVSSFYWWHIQRS